MVYSCLVAECRGSWQGRAMSTENRVLLGRAFFFGGFFFMWWAMGKDAAVGYGAAFMFAIVAREIMRA